MVNALPKDPTGSCYATITVAIVCTPWSCGYETYVDDYWCSRTPGYDFDPPGHNPADIDINRAIDDFKDVLATNDPCAWQFDSNDGLGSNYGGPNTVRPGHTGIDMQADRGDDVATVGHGEITYVGWQNPSDHKEGCGYMMEVSHVNGDKSIYCHLLAGSEQFSLFEWVRSGTVIGQANSTGNSSGDHLHLTYKQNGTTRIEFWDVTGTQPNSSQMNGGC